MVLQNVRPLAHQLQYSSWQYVWCGLIVVNVKLRPISIILLNPTLTEIFFKDCLLYCHRAGKVQQCTFNVSVIYEKPEVHPIISQWQNSFQKHDPPDFKFYRGKLTYKKIPIWCMVSFESIFTALNNTEKAKKTYSKLTLHHMGKCFIS